MSHRIRRFCLIFTSLVALNAAAQEYPAKPVRFVITGGAGGSTDVVARVVGDRLAGGLGSRSLMI